MTVAHVKAEVHFIFCNDVRLADMNRIFDCFHLKAITAFNAMYKCNDRNRNHESVDILSPHHR